jgi:high frequency lysogenization protein
MKQQTDSQDIVLALAGVFQAAVLVRDLARHGKTNECALQASLQTLYCLNPENVAQIYGQQTNFRLGLQALVQTFGRSKVDRDKDIGRYLMGLLHLERKLHRAPEQRKMLAQRMKHALAQANYFASSPQRVIQGLAESYVATLGKLSFRLHVIGQTKYLRRPETVDQIRAVLLAGVRSVILWRQLEGTRWQLFFKHRHFANVAQQMLAMLPADK